MGLSGNFTCSILHVLKVMTFKLATAQADPHFWVTNLSEKKKKVIFWRALFPRLSFSCSISALEALIKK